MPALRRLLLPLLLLFCAAVAAADAGTAQDVRRPFRMGFSPWPWDATPAAVEWTYETIQRHGDIVSFHVEEGVPWNEALSGAAFPAAMQKDIEARLAHVRQDMPRILQVSALDVARSGLAGRRGSGINEPLSAPWSTYGMGHPDVKAAYANYVERMIRTFRPTYVVFGVEANLLKRNRKQQWSAYVELTCATYRTLKGRGVGPPLLVSIDVNPFFPEWSTPDPAGDRAGSCASSTPASTASRSRATRSCPRSWPTRCRRTTSPASSRSPGAGSASAKRVIRRRCSPADR